MLHTRHHRRLRPFALACPVLVALLILPTRADAIPAFARKYRTSCQTCHIAFPKLNPFGEAFRLLGYRMPAETEDMVKELPLPLGAPAYKRLWPQAVWPSDMPGTVPLSVSTTFSDASSRMTEDGMEETVTNDFRFPEEVALLSGGTLGETLSFFGEVVFGQTVEEGEAGVEVEIEHAQFNFNGPFGWGPAFNLKVGRFAPEITQTFSHGHVLTTGGPAALLQFVPIAAHGGAEVGGHEGGAGIALPHMLDGLEVYGILGHRFLYSGGLANGIGPGMESMDGNSAKDVFGRVAYKLGGLAYDGSNFVASDKNWQETSVSLGLFAYRGDGNGVLFPGHEEGDLVEDQTFTRVGVDANVFVRDLNVLFGFVRGRDTLAMYAAMDGVDEDAALELEDAGDFTYKAWFVQGEYVLLPWLDGALRYEWLRPAREGEPDFKRIVPNVTALIRANVKAYAEYQRNLGESDNYVFLGGLRFAF